jgi:predicted Zn-dependent protease
MRFIKDWGFNKCRGERARGDSGIAPTRIRRFRISHEKAISRLLRFVFAVCLMCFISSQAVSSPPPDPGNLPPLKVHPLPQSLALWEQNNQGDYFDQIKTTPLGYLVWSKFPLKIYVDSITPENTAANLRFQQWTAAARKAITEWNVYLPLQEVQTKDAADILILRSQSGGGASSVSARKVKLNPETGLYDIPRAVAAQTNYEFYLTPKPEAIATRRRSLIVLRMTMEISPNFMGTSLLATIRHELGHALGIWGHSPKPDDALYFSQVSDPPSISPRDINTLKKIYQQPTRLGWKI